MARTYLLWRAGKAGILDGEIHVWLASVTDAALSLAHLQYDLSISRFCGRARGCWFGGEIGAAAGARRVAYSRRPFFLPECRSRRDLSNKSRYPCGAAHGRNWPDPEVPTAGPAGPLT